MFQSRVVDVAGKIAEHSEQDQEAGKQASIAVWRRTLAPQERGATESDEARERIGKRCHY